MKKQTILARIAYLVWKNKNLPVATIHSAGGLYCVSGDRRLRELHALYMKKDFCVGYLYDKFTPKQYKFSFSFRMFCRKYFVTRAGLAEMPPVRVQTPQKLRYVSVPSPSSVLVPCAFCGADFHRTDSRPNKDHCSDKCRVAAWRLRKGKNRQELSQDITGSHQVSLGQIPVHNKGD